MPYTYLWPPSLVPKPADWGPHIDLANFIFYDQAQTYEPPRALLDFLAAGEAPIYVGFGSVTLRDIEEAKHLGLNMASELVWIVGFVDRYATQPPHKAIG